MCGVQRTVALRSRRVRVGRAETSLQNWKSKSESRSSYKTSNVFRRLSTFVFSVLSSGFDRLRGDRRDSPIFFFELFCVNRSLVPSREQSIIVRARGHPWILRLLTS